MSPVNKKPAVSSGFCEADEGARTLDLLHGKPHALAITATVGTTLAPWGLAFIQSYAADKKLAVADLRYERIGGCPVRRGISAAVR